MRLSRVLAIVSALLPAVAGCATQGIPGMRVDPVTRFSLGSTKFKPFKTRPSAKGLLTAALRLYDSFDTAAATSKHHSQSVYGWAVPEGGSKAEDIKMTKSEETVDFRAARPGKELIKGDGKSITVRNGKTGFTYFPSKGIYLSSPVSVEQHMPVQNWIGLTWGPFSSTKLLPDQKISGTAVYVLELRASEKRGVHGGVTPAVRIWVFLGKNDLLPRRVETLELRSGEEATVQGLPDNIDRQDFRGFVANSELPDDLFPTEPPKGAKPASGKVILN